MRHLAILTAAIALTTAASTVHAGCVDPRNVSAAASRTIPGFIVADLLPKSPEADTASAPHASGFIVGTWLVTYTAGGNPAGQALIQWHSDRTEWENINFPIEGGNICVGSWKAVDASHVSRSHMGWLYTAGLLTGYFTETETVLIKNRKTYTGVTDTKIFDTAGNVQVEFPGASSAVRLAP